MEFMQWQMHVVLYLHCKEASVGQPVRAYRLMQIILVKAAAPNSCLLLFPHKQKAPLLMMASTLLDADFLHQPGFAIAPPHLHRLAKQANHSDSGQAQPTCSKRQWLPRCNTCTKPLPGC